MKKKILATSSLAFSPDGRFLASGSPSGLLLLWDARTGKLLRVFDEQIAAVKSVEFSRDGKWLASGSEDFTVCVRDTKTWKLQTTIGERHYQHQQIM